MNDLRTYHAPQSSMNSAEGLSKKAIHTSSCSATHTIHRGESLSEIAKQYGMTLEHLLAENPLVNPHYYRAGTQLSVAATTQTVCCEGRLYCVQIGDTIETIVTDTAVSEEALLTANPILTKIGLIPGQIICIPAEPIPPDNALCPGAVARIAVEPGETFADILIEYNISYNALQSLNPSVNLTTLTTGQQLCIPPSGTRGTCLDCDATYIILTGENIDAVSKKAMVSIGDLMQANPTFLPEDFTAGMMICLP